MNEHKSVFLAWQSPDTRDWHIVGSLTQAESNYNFRYTKGALASDKFIPFSGMEELNKSYFSENLFPLFQNRLLSSKRPEYPEFIKWLRLDEENADPVTVLGRSGGVRGTDQFQTFSKFEINANGEFEHLFFAHGLRYLAEHASDRVSTLKNGEKILMCLDRQNDYDKNAVIIRAENPAEIVGYCPRYIAKDLTKIINDDESHISLEVESLSNEAPINYRLLCKAKGKISPSLHNSFMCKDDYEFIS
jgi:HIRAN domain